MSKKTGRLKEAAFEVLIELFAFALFFGLGALILHLFGENLNFAQIDPELIALVGIGAVLAAAVAVIAVIYLVRKLRGVKKGADSTDENGQKGEEENDHQ